MRQRNGKLRSSVFGQKASFGGFGSTSTPASPFGSTNQQSQPAFGSSIFGSSSPFGATSQSAFSASSAPAFGATSTPAFGAMSAPAFGATSTPAFGAMITPAFGTKRNKMSILHLDRYTSISSI
ncbi:hypothetical protein I3843_10G091200 [Carya illinoinensis]|uniref:nuclear pore complex protein NUP98A-like n=1 Tax=Carya illinoinensis TaxID=32201 RepID=UPI001C727F97|nr:nuclear pore complex protein NUP98A-like [Carya illinoinensis]KAG7959883.1 hypothetical protein I3843_10G091200 [Carya illinoinensis]KAG7959884.1 hypothetical protein I3843_10G091200 [Carya illinoinensis]